MFYSWIEVRAGLSSARSACDGDRFERTQEDSNRSVNTAEDRHDIDVPSGPA